MDGFKLRKAFGHQGHEILQQVGLSTKNDNSDPSLPQILLVFKPAINSQNNVKFCCLGCGQKLTVLKSSKAGVSSCLAIVTGKVVAQSLAHAFVEKNPHSHLGG
jgi:hypothetical protein